MEERKFYSQGGMKASPHPRSEFPPLPTRAAAGAEQTTARAGPELGDESPSPGNASSCRPGPFTSNPLC